MEIPSTVTTIGSSAFGFCPALTSITIPEGVTTIEAYAFEACFNLTTVKIPVSVVSIGEYAFHGSNEVTVTYPGTIDQWKTLMGETAVRANCADGLVHYWGKCGDNLTFHIVGEKLSLFGTGAMWDAIYWAHYRDHVTEVSLPDGITTLSNAAFSRMPKLTGITIPDTVTDIQYCCFEYSTGLESITIPQSVTTIGGRAFEGCAGLKEIIFKGNAPTIASGAFLNNATIAYYPVDDPSWTEAVRKNYGGQITWRTRCVGEHTPMDCAELAPTCTETGLTEGVECSVCGLTLEGREEIPALGHSYEAGYCVRCDAYEPALLEDGFYRISNGGQLYWFAQQVDSENMTPNAVLTADIVLNENLKDKIVISEDNTLAVKDGETVREWTPIGNGGYAYGGTFDGAGHSISGLYYNTPGTDYVGLFGHVDGTIRNVRLTDSYLYASGERVAGIAGEL